MTLSLSSFLVKNLRKKRILKEKLRSLYNNNMKLIFESVKFTYVYLIHKEINEQITIYTIHTDYI